MSIQNNKNTLDELEDLVKIYLLVGYKVPSLKAALQKKLVHILSFYKGQLLDDPDQILRILDWLILVDPDFRSRYHDEKQGIFKRKQQERDKNYGKPVIKLSSSVPTVVFFGQSVSLSWEVANASIIELSDAENKLLPHKNNAATVLPKSDNDGVSYISYKLIAKNEKGADEAYFDFIVLPVPVLDYIPSTFPTFELNSALFLELGVPELNLHNIADQFIAQPTFYPEMMKSFYLKEALTLHHKNLINTNLIYERIKRFFRTGSFF